MAKLITLKCLSIILALVPDCKDKRGLSRARYNRGMPFFHAKTPLDRAFEISLLLKGLDGLFETVAGTLFLFVKPDLVLRIAHGLVGYSPDDYLSKHLLTSAEHFS